MDLGSTQLLTETSTSTFTFNSFIFVDRNSSVGIATRYGLKGPGIKSRCGRNFSHPSRPAQGPTLPPIQLVSVLFPGSKVAGAWC